MTETVLAMVWIGGRLLASRAHALVDAINKTCVFAYEGDTYYQPRNAADLVAAVTPEGFLHLCDDSAPNGEMPAIIEVCREVELPYRHWCEATGSGGAQVTMWAPSMSEPIVFGGDCCDPGAVILSISRLTDLLELHKLEAQIPIISPFELVDRKEPRTTTRPDLSLNAR